MRRNWMGCTVAALALGALAVSIAAADDDGPRLAPEVREVKVSFDGAKREVVSAARRGRGRPKIVYLQGQPVTVDPGDPGAGEHVDIALSSPACTGKSRIVDGGTVASRSDVYQQGTYVNAKAREYHVLLGIGASAPDDPYTVSSHLICVKGLR